MSKTDFNLIISGTDYRIKLVPYEYYTEFSAENTLCPEDKAVVAGAVKWDGCTNYDFPETKDCMLHGCSREDLVGIGTLLGKIWDRCMDICPRSHLYQALTMAGP